MVLKHCLWNLEWDRNIAWGRLRWNEKWTGVSFIYIKHQKTVSGNRRKVRWRDGIKAKRTMRIWFPFLIPFHSDLGNPCIFYHGLFTLSAVTWAYLAINDKQFIREFPKEMLYISILKQSPRQKSGQGFMIFYRSLLNFQIYYKYLV